MSCYLKHAAMIIPSQQSGTEAIGFPVHAAVSPYPTQVGTVMRHDGAAWFTKWNSMVAMMCGPKQKQRLAGSQAPGNEREE
jgi:hypothetical protein